MIQLDLSDIYRYHIQQVILFKFTRSTHRKKLEIISDGMIMETICQNL